MNEIDPQTLKAVKAAVSASQVCRQNLDTPVYMTLRQLHRLYAVVEAAKLVAQSHCTACGDEDCSREQAYEACKKAVKGLEE